MKNIIMIQLGFILFLSILLCGCAWLSQGYFLDVINENQYDYLAFSQQEFDQFPGTFQSAFNTSSKQINITMNDISSFLDIINSSSNTVTPQMSRRISEAYSFCGWWAYLGLNDQVYHFYLCYENSESRYIIINNLTAASLEISDIQMQEFPTLKKMIETNDTSNEAPYAEFLKLHDLLDIVDTNYIRNQGIIYEIGLYHAD